MSEINYNGGKMPPQAIEFEEAVIGAIMLTKDAFDRAIVLKPEYFYDECNMEIFKVQSELSANHKPIDVLTVAAKLKENEVLDKVGGHYKLALLTSKVSSAAHIEYHCAVIYDKYCLRELISLSGETIAQSFEEGADMKEIQNNIVLKIDQLTIKEGREAVDFHSGAKKRIKEIEETQTAGIKLTGINTGFLKLNAVTNGWQKSDLIILAARPGEGKSALLCNFANHVAEQKIPVGIFSLEMSTSQFVDRLIGIRSGVYGVNIKRAELTEDNWMFIAKTKYDIPLYIDDTPGLSLVALRSKARRMVKMYGVKMIAIDYLQLMSSGSSKNKNREGEISDISRGLKILAKELEIPVIALAQLSRKAEERKGRPILSDLRESGSIEQDADIVMFIYNPNSDDKTDLHPKVELIIGKNRQGGVGINDMVFNKQTQVFKDYEGENNSNY
jgi:replicative DNA helicase